MKKFWVIFLLFIVLKVDCFSAEKQILLEMQCGATFEWTPDGLYYLDSLVKLYPDKIIPVTLHQLDAMEIPEAKLLSDKLNVPFYPRGTLNRKQFDGEYYLSFLAWFDNINELLSEVAVVTVEVIDSTDNYNDVLYITVRIKALEEINQQIALNCFILEDSLSGTGSGWDQVNAVSGKAGYEQHPYYSQPPLIQNFIHNRVVRAMLGGAWGDSDGIPNIIPVNAEVFKSFNWKISDISKIQNISVVGLAQIKENDGYEILNSQKVNLGTKLITIETLSENLFCSGDILNADYNLIGNFHNDDWFYLVLSDENGNFTNHTILDSIQGTAKTIFENITLPLTIKSGSNYFLKVIAKDGKSISYKNSSPIIIEQKPKAEVLNVKGNSINACENDYSFYYAQKGYKYFWEVTNGTIQTGGNKDTVFVLWGAIGTGKLKLSVSSNQQLNHCKDEIEYNVVISARPLDLTEKEIIIKSGEKATIEFNEVQGCVIRWFSSKTGGNPIFEGNIFETPALSDTTYYYVECFDTATGCTSTNRVKVSVNVDKKESIKYNLISDYFEVCQGADVKIGITGDISGGNPPYTFSWQPATGLDKSNDSVAIATVEKSIEYFITVRDKNNDSTQKRIYVFAKKLPFSPFIANKTVNEGEKAIITIRESQANVIFIWYESEFAGNSFYTGMEFETEKLYEKIDFYVEGRDTVTGCSSKKRTKVTCFVNKSSNIVVKLLSSSEEICKGDTVKIGLKEAVTGGVPPYSYEWIPNENISSNSDSVVDAYPLQSTDYKLIVKDSKDSTAEMIVNVAVFHSPELPIVKDTIVEKNKPFILEALCSRPTETARWYREYVGGTLLHTGNTLSVQGIEFSTAYFVEAFDTVNGCISEGRSKIEVIIDDGSSKLVIMPEDTLDFGGVLVKGYIPYIEKNVRIFNNSSNSININLALDNPEIFSTTSMEYTIPANSIHSFKIRFEPKEIKHYLNTITIITKTSQKKLYLRGIGVDPEDRSFTAFIVLDDSLRGYIGRKLRQNVKIQNIGNTPIVLNRLPELSNTDYFEIDRNHFFAQRIIYSSKIDSIPMQFKPTDTSVYMTMLRLYDAKGRFSEASIIAKGIMDNPNSPKSLIKVRVEPDSVAPGDLAEVQIILDTLVVGPYSNTARVFSAFIEYNSDILSRPINNDVNIQDKGVNNTLRTIEISGQRPYDKTINHVLASFQSKCYFPTNYKYTPIIVRSFEWKDLSATGLEPMISYMSDSLIFVKICQVGGERIIKRKAVEPTALLVKPNPVNDYFDIDFNIPEPGYVRISINDIIGNEKLVLKENYYDEGDYTLSVDGNLLGIGLYMVVLQNFDRVQTHQFMIVR